MSENSEKLQAALAEAQALLDQIKQLKVQTEEQFKLAETARKNADSEGLFAVNAKRTCEEHATAISKLKGTVETDIKSIETNKQKADELAAYITANKPVIEADVNKIGESRKDVDNAATIIEEAAEKGAGRIKEIEESKTAANSSLAKINELRDSTVEANKKTEVVHAQAEDLLKKITDAQGKSSESSEKISGILTDAEKHHEDLNKVVEHLLRSDEITGGFEKNLKALKEEAEGLLPGFADVSLASAFSKRKKRFLIPSLAWILTFIVCIGCLIYIAYPSFHEATTASINLHNKSWGDIWLGLALRLPIVLPFIWLAIYAGRNYMLSIRIEEDYAYKEALSKSFAGYKREMEKFATGQAAGQENPLTILCSNVLRAMAEHPGRIYEAKQKDINLMTETHGAAEKAVEFSKRQLAAR